MTTALNVVGIAGSLRQASFSRRLLMALRAVSPSELVIENVGIGDLPLYNQDLDDNPPQAWLQFRERIRRADAVLFVTPEYNRSVPGVLKNALDVGSRPYGHSVWDSKPCAVVSCSPGAIGGFGAQHHLRQSLAYLNMPTMTQPEAYLGGIDKLVSTEGRFVATATRDFGRSFMLAFEMWIERHVPPAHRAQGITEEALDEALVESFPASDPLPMHPGAD